MPAGPKTLGITAAYTRSFVKYGVFHVGAKANVSLYATRELVSDVKRTQMYLQLNVLGAVSAAVERCDIHIAFGPELCFVRQGRPQDGRPGGGDRSEVSQD